MPEFVCSICLYVPPVPGEDRDATLTVIAGHLVCVDHAAYVRSFDHMHATNRVADAPKEG